MNRLPVFWVPAPEEEDADDFERYIVFRLRETWLSVDSEQLILPVTLLERDGNRLEESQVGILKQFGGEGLLNDILLSDQEFETGSEWLLSHQEGIGRSIEPVQNLDQAADDLDEDDD